MADPIAIISALISLVVLGLLIWVIVLMYKWFKNPKQAPTWMQNLYFYMYPRGYDRSPADVAIIESGNVNKFIQVKNSTLANCASNCTLSANCNAFFFAGSNCYYEKDDFLNDTTTLVKSNLFSVFGEMRTYVASDAKKPTLMYTARPGTSYNSVSSLIKTTSDDQSNCMATCNTTANCVAISTLINTTSNNCFILSNTDTSTTDANLWSFVLETVTFEPASLEED